MAAAGLGASSLLADRVAAADVEGALALNLGVAVKREAPALHIDSTDTSARSMEAGRVANRGGMAMVGAGFDLGMVVDDRWLVPTFGVAAYTAAGAYPAVVTSVDGSTATLRPWTAGEIDVLLPGLGIRAKRRRWSFSAFARLGLGLVHERLGIAAGPDTFDVTGWAVGFLLDVDLVGCRRLDPEQRVCIALTPRVYDFGVVNGGTAALRFEWGR